MSHTADIAPRNGTRPTGRLVWFHIGNSEAEPVVSHLIRRMLQALPDVRCLVSSPGWQNLRETDRMIPVPPPEDRRQPVQKFLQDWDPDVTLWVNGGLQSVLLNETLARRRPIYLLDGGMEAFAPFRGMLANWRAKSVLRQFDRMLLKDEAAANRAKSLGAQAWTVEVTGPLEEGPPALPHDEEDRRDLAQALDTRPVWFAMAVPEAEIDAVLSAHAEAMRHSHRYLLILRPSDAAASAKLVAQAAEMGMQVSTRSSALVPGEEDNVMLADLPEERGLWYRVSPTTYLGGTFAGTPSPNPFEPAALGSSILYGPHLATHGRGFSRLQEAGGAILLNGPGELGALLRDLLHPDRAAKLAHAAWDVVSSGAPVTDRVIGLTQSALPMKASD